MTITHLFSHVVSILCYFAPLPSHQLFLEVHLCSFHGRRCCSAARCRLVRVDWRCVWFVFVYPSPAGNPTHWVRATCAHVRDTAGPCAHHPQRTDPPPTAVAPRRCVGCVHGRFAAGLPFTPTATKRRAKLPTPRAATCRGSTFRGWHLELPLSPTMMVSTAGRGGCVGGGPRGTAEWRGPHVTAAESRCGTRSGAVARAPDSLRGAC